MKTIKNLLLLMLILCMIIPLTLSASDKPTIAVLRFENKSAFDRLDPFEIALPYMLISDLSKISSIQLVERDKIDKLMTETGLTEKDLMDPATAQRIGNALGADIIVIGSFVEQVESGKTVKESNLSITLKLENVSTGKVIKKIQVEGKSKGFFTLEKKLVRLLTETLEFVPTQEEADSIRKIATRSLEAAIHFARGKEFQFKAANYYGEKKYNREDQKKFLLEAIKEFETALYLDPQYADAQYEMIPSYNSLDIFFPLEKKYCLLHAKKMEIFIEKYPDDARVPRCLTMLAWFYEGAIGDDHDKAIKYYKKRILEYSTTREMIEQSIWGLINEYEIYKRDYANAIKWTHFLMEHYPESRNETVLPAKISGYYGILRINMRFKFYEQALSILDYIINNKIFSEPYYNKAEDEKCFPNMYVDDLLCLRKLKGDIYLEMEDYVTAVKIWERLAKELDKLPDSKSIIESGICNFSLESFWYGLGDAYLRQDDHHHALYAFNKVISVCKDNRQTLSKVYLEIGNIHKKEGEWEKALEAYLMHRDLLYDKAEKGGCSFNELKKNIQFCREKLGIKDCKLIYWKPYYPFPKNPRKVKVDKRTTKYVHEDYKATSLRKRNSHLWIVFSYQRKSHKSNDINNITIEEDGWFVIRIDPQTFKKNFLLKIPSEFGVNYIKDICVDDDEIWLACGDKGVLRYDRSLKKWKYYTTKNKLLHNTIWSIVSTPNAVWFGFGDEGRGGIMKYDKTRQVWQVYYDKYSTATAVTVLAVDGDSLWVGAGDGTISRFDTVTRLWKIIKRGKYYGAMSGIHPMIHGIVSGNYMVRDIILKNGKAWFACGNGGIKVYDTRNEQWSLWYAKEIYDKKTQKRRKVQMDFLSVAVDENNLWAGDFYSGVYRINLTDGKWCRENIDISRTNSIAITGDVVWFAYADGIMRFFKNGVKDEASQISNK